MSADSFQIKILTDVEAGRFLVWMDPDLFNKNRGQCIEGDRYKTIARKMPAEIISASNMMLTRFSTWFLSFGAIISAKDVPNKFCSVKKEKRKEFMHNLFTAFF